MGARLAALQKILGKVGSQTAGAAKGFGKLGSTVGPAALESLQAGGKGLGEIAGLTGKGIANVAKKNPYGAGVLGAGAAGAAGAGAYGLNELLEELGLADDEDEELGEDPRHAARARAARGGAM